MAMPVQRPATSKQDVATPPEFITALCRRLGIEEFNFDLAANADNSVAGQWFYSEGDNSLDQTWNITRGWAFCNPPFGEITPWVHKAAIEADRGAKVAMLVPASVGSNWWAAYVDMEAHVLFLQGRLTFVGHTAPYPKDCAILLYSSAVKGGYEVWDWR